MAFVPTTPISGLVPQPTVAQDLDAFYIHSLRFTLLPGEPTKTKLHIEWSEGYMDGGNYVPVNRFAEVWDAAEDLDLATAINTTTSGGTIYDEMKTSLWTFLQTKGKIGEGTIS